MKNLKGYTINFGSLSDGKHKFEYVLDAKFFQNFENSIIQDGLINVVVWLEKQIGLLTLEFDLQGTVKSECDICAEEFDLAIANTDTLLVKFVNEIIESDEPDVTYLEHGSIFISIAQYLYELVTLAIPMRKVHPKDAEGNRTCNPKVLEFLKAERKKAAEKKRSEPTEKTNSVWDALKSLKSDKNNS